ncbi:ABC transporter ATP-binding protein [Oceanobacillus sp. J11TS1]|uniref:ABC transporter ATP-binding protein n=1 Tax=Oceanobacillus sp. J11TS1 TaxID=2807191 RepID=UPI001B11F908|nr:ABC transporter ATP-binding protein [Oceanobacillus sp. J11TS1]GIO21466.1 bacitracin ABC transporter ATP-binding protein [Oceanobacillus sp. J11TS1]
MEALQTHQLTKKYGKKTVVDSIDLCIPQGTIFGFLGKNGAGKSTFINMVTGLIQPSSGSYEILGHPQKRLDSIQKEIGVLPDYSTFYDDLTAFSHLNYFQKLLKQSLSKQDILHILKQVGLEGAEYIKVKKYSFGMKKKLGIAQSIIHQPKLLFLDEPTSGVDANAVLNIHALIKQIAAQGTTIFLTSHNLNEVEKLCDEIAIMNKGGIQTQGTMKQLQEQHQQDIVIHIHHRPLYEQEQSELQNSFKGLAEKIQIGDTTSEFTVQTKKLIPQVNKYFVRQDIDVFRLEVEEASLEEIFLNLK